MLELYPVKTPVISMFSLISVAEVSHPLNVDKTPRPMLPHGAFELQSFLLYAFLHSCFLFCLFPKVLMKEMPENESHL